MSLKESIAEDAATILQRVFARDAAHLKERKYKRGFVDAK